MAVCLIVPLLAGCAALSRSRPAEGVNIQQIAVAAPVVSGRISPVKVSSSDKPVVAKKPQFGLIAGKTDFQGLLKAPYVRFEIVRQDDPADKFFFYIGSKGNQSVVPWGEEKVVEPGYFTLQLAPGVYKILHIAIPVGSTIAEESLELDFEVAAGKVCYVGTLDVEGTKEKVKFGGVPLLRPGFDYRLAVRDEMGEAVTALQNMLPPDMPAVERRLFKIVAVQDGDIPPTDVLKPGIRK
ncbi:MAG: hypothetical protein HGA80_03770 [Candidatus Omnitrophica bacterium]|nr:hypothetical protein [Candidatus Omnitrophota bacterium]